jgi:1-acyl-sn-glycerol-3-phosphate acyltransferase
VTFRPGDPAIFYREVSRFHLTEVKVIKRPELTEYYDAICKKWFTSFCYRVSEPVCIAEVYELRLPRIQVQTV